MEVLKKYQIYYTTIWLSGVEQRKGQLKKKKRKENESCGRFICLQKKHVLQSIFLEKVLSFFYHIFGILNSFSNPCTSKTLYCYFLVIFKSNVQTTIHFAYGGLIIESLRETLTFATVFLAVNCFDTSLASQELHYFKIEF